MIPTGEEPWEGSRLGEFNPIGVRPDQLTQFGSILLWDSIQVN